MRGLLVALLCVTAACSKKQSESPPPRPAPDLSSGVPEAVLDRFGESNTVFAVDVAALYKGSNLDGARDAPIFQGLGCAVDVFMSSGVAVVAVGDTIEAYVARMPEESTKHCIDVLEPIFHWKAEGSGPTYEVVVDHARYSLVWGFKTMHLTEVGAPAKGKLSPELRALIRRVPKAAVFWVAWLTMKDQPPNTVAWGEVMSPNLRVSVIPGGTPEQRQQMFDTVIALMKSFAEKKHQVWDDAWIKSTADALVLEVPLDVVMPGSPNP